MDSLKRLQAETAAEFDALLPANLDRDIRLARILKPQRFNKVKSITQSVVVFIALGLVSFNLWAQTSAPPLATLKAAAENGDAQAQARLGDVYRSQLDSENALLWYRRAATQGVAHAQSEAGRILIGFANSPLAKPEVKATHAEEAIHWSLKAANQGDQAAQVELGRQYESGKLIKQDKVESYKWFTLAAKGGNPLVPKELEAKWARDTLILKLSQDQIAEGQRRAAAFKPHQVPSVGAPEPAWVQEIRLQGLSGSEERRLAIINGQTFQKGDRAEIKAGSKTVKIFCVDVEQTSVTITIDGLNQPRELKLSAKPDGQK